MKKEEFELKCALLAKTPQSQWFNLRYKAFINLIKQNEIKVIDIHDVFINTLFYQGGLFKIENEYYFFLVAVMGGRIIEYFNVEKLTFKELDNTYKSTIILSSDDSDDRFNILSEWDLFGEAKSLYL